MGKHHPSLLLTSLLSLLLPTPALGQGLLLPPRPPNNLPALLRLHPPVLHSPTLLLPNLTNSSQPGGGRSPLSTPLHQPLPYFLRLLQPRQSSLGAGPRR